MMECLVVENRRTSSQPLEAIMAPARQKYAMLTSLPDMLTTRPRASGAVHSTYMTG